MITDPSELQLLDTIEQHDYRVANVSRESFERLCADFLTEVPFDGATFLDLGVGHYDFGEMARLRGAQTYAVDYDPTIVALGRQKRFPVVEANLERVTRDDFDTVFDGILCKYSCNAFTFYNDLAGLRRRPQQLVEMMRPHAWAWIAPWNGRTDLVAGVADREARQILAAQIDSFQNAGFAAFELSLELSQYYGVHGTTENRPLFVRNLPIPARLAACSRY